MQEREKARASSFRRGGGMIDASRPARSLSTRMRPVLLASWNVEGEVEDTRLLNNLVRFRFVQCLLFFWFFSGYRGPLLLKTRSVLLVRSVNVIAP